MRRGWLPWIRHTYYRGADIVAQSKTFCGAPTDKISVQSDHVRSTRRPTRLTWTHLALEMLESDGADMRIPNGKWR